MAKKQFKAESKRLLELMIHSIYTHKEIFLREIVSNASDALDKLAYLSLTDDKVGMSRSDFGIEIKLDQGARTITVTDNGIGMTKEELESNLGVIARSGSLQFKKEMEQSSSGENMDIIGQFGVGFYSAFMVSDEVTVTSRAYGSDEAWRWKSAGADGYTVEESRKDTVGTEIVMKLKEDTEEEQYGRFLDAHEISALVKKYSDYIRYPIRMEMVKHRRKDKAEGTAENAAPEWETYMETETLNSMVPIWQRPKSEVSDEEYRSFYKEKFMDYEDPAAVITVSAEGAVTYKALLFVPARAPFDFYTREFEKGLQLYSSGVLIMDKCPELLPDHFRFVRGVVDSQDLSLNISREMLQHTRGLKVISANLEKKIKAELRKLLENDRPGYERFWKAFGLQIKYGIAAEYGAHKDLLRDLLLFYSSAEEKYATLAEYVSRMKEDQKYIYYAAGDNVARLGKLPQTERLLEKGYEILYLTDEVDEFVVQILGKVEEKELKSVNDDNAVPESKEEQEKHDKQIEENRGLLDFVKETLGDKIKEARVSRKLKSHAVCMTADGPVSLEMEKYFRSLPDAAGEKLTAERVLELNPEHPAVEALRSAFETDREKAALYARVLYYQSLLMADLPIEDPAEYSRLVYELMK
ncbi:molecular chaperone HtpG [Papillibacter cinnamivorans]|uniref:Chaperone protein HtpG n=1 Tax=Papillibacter cinnamivorans DSM 12816 TaxID=1122930 RepID=A0A1W2A011_9FIRM|nr:molecular chaperone HtpG [Papillibacter cinnamivorans]SMC53963.1 molecular chaperone HtpG [Papillibacter cinnamivorans DSM 12816]